MKVKNNILLISNMYPSKKYPHYGVFVKNTSSILMNNGYKVKVVAMNKVNRPTKKLFAYIRLYVLTIFHGLFGNFNIIYAHYASHTALPLLFINKIRKIPIVMNVHGNDVVPETKKDLKYQGLVKRVLSCADSIICPSEYFERELITRYGVNENKITIYPSGGVDTTKYVEIDRQFARDRMKLPPNMVLIGYVGRIEQNKGWDLFLDACKEIVDVVPNCRFVVVGDGTQISAYNEKVNQYGLNKYIFKFDFLSQEELVYIYNALNIFVFSTHRKSESLGLVGLEAMACGTICVLPDEYGPSSYGKDNINAFVFRTNSLKSLIDTILEGIKYQGSLIQQNARKTALTYDSKRTEKILINLFNYLVENLPQ